MDKKLKIVSLLSLIFFLASCGMFSDPEGQDTMEQQETSNNEEENSPYTIEEQVDSDYYRPVITEDGTYRTSESRGVTLQLNSGINIKLFEEDLIRLSQDYFSTDTHYFQEGQFLSEDTITSWLERESSDNEEGLNPPSNDSTDPEEREPNYLSSILEHDFYVQTEDGLELAGISVGLAMNSVDYYPAYQYGPTLEQNIETEEIIEVGQEMADEVVSRMRNIEGLEDIPIMVGVYEQAPNDDLSGGVYLTRGLSDGGAETVDDWEQLNENRVIFPLQGGETTEGNMFRNFQSEVENFFPNLSGVTGRAHYINDALISLEVDIMTQFYGKGEMIAFTQYLNTAANNYLPENIQIDIKVESQNGIEAFLQRDTNEEGFYTHVFN